MQKQKENQFRDKFRLLNSQEHTEEIIWSTSESSEYDESTANDKFNNITNRTRILKRKRRKNVTKNISNLSVTVLDTYRDRMELQSGETSPILVSKQLQKSFQKSPILAQTQTCRLHSPVLPKSSYQKSPIIKLKSDSPKPGSVRKKLFMHQNLESSPSPIETSISSIFKNDDIIVKTEIDSDYAIEDNLTCGSKISEHRNTAKEVNPKHELVNKVKSFFDSHFSSESTPQNSQTISEIQTQRNSTKTSDEAEILTCKESDNSKSIKLQNQSGHSSENSFYTFNKTKKVRYKKGSLAYRLNNLLKKQSACLSLWHHERYLAANSNFVIPKGENVVFRIQKVKFQYGCYLLETIDLNEDYYLVLINSCYVSDNIISDTIIKVYEPFKVVQYNNDIRLLINVCRFECSPYTA